jgi:hypothetical protein
MKLYWRVKVEDKWTWRPAKAYLQWDESGSYWIVRHEEEMQ